MQWFYRRILIILLISSSASPLALDEPAAEKLTGLMGSFTYQGNEITYLIEQQVEGLNYPWSVAIISDSQFLITERNGGLRLLNRGIISEPASGLPSVYAKSQGGLLDVVLHPEFSLNKQLFISYSFGGDQQNATRLISAVLNIENPKKPSLSQVKELFTVAPLKNTPAHYGARIALLTDKTLLLTTGDGFDFREQAQVLTNQMGKVIRLNFDGSIPTNNPFIGNKDANDAIYSFGHRNPQGLIFDHKRQQIFLHEHGPKGGDEINLIEAGNNYGWPIATFGKDYAGSNISPFTEYPGTIQPLLHWTPSIAPSGFAVYYGSQFSELNGDFLVGSLVNREVRLVTMEGEKTKEQISLFKEVGARIRDVRVAKDGAIYLLTDDSNGKLLKISRR